MLATRGKGVTVKSGTDPRAASEAGEGRTLQRHSGPEQEGGRGREGGLSGAAFPFPASLPARGAGQESASVIGRAQWARLSTE